MSAADHRDREPRDDVETVRDWLDETIPDSLPGTRQRMFAALDRITERLATAERERDDVETDRDLYDLWRAKANDLADQLAAIERERDGYAEDMRVYLDSTEKAEARIAALTEGLREIVNMLGPEHFGGELEGLVAEGNEALRIARTLLADQPTEEPAPSE